MIAVSWLPCWNFTNPTNNSTVNQQDPSSEWWFGIYNMYQSHSQTSVNKTAPYIKCNTNAIISVDNEPWWEVINWATSVSCTTLTYLVSRIESNPVTGDARLVVEVHLGTTASKFTSTWRFPVPVVVWWVDLRLSMKALDISDTCLLAVSDVS